MSFSAENVAQSEHDEPYRKDEQSHLRVRYLVHHEGDEDQEGDADVIDDGIAQRFEMQTVCLAFAHFCLAEAQMRYDDDKPANEHCRYCYRQEVHEYLAGEQVVEHYGYQRDAGGDEDA